MQSETPTRRALPSWVRRLPENVTGNVLANVLVALGGVLLGQLWNVIRHVGAYAPALLPACFTFYVTMVMGVTLRRAGFQFMRLFSLRVLFALWFSSTVYSGAVLATRGSTPDVLASAGFAGVTVPLGLYYMWLRLRAAIGRARSSQRAPSSASD
jgi:hypothetical protein